LRKYVIGAAVLVAALITAALAFGATQRQYTENFAPSATEKPTTKPNTPTGIYFSEDSQDPTNPNNHQPIQDDQDTMIFPPGTSIDQSAAPQCGASDNDFMQQGDSACPKKSNLGTGHAKLRTKFNGTNDIPATVTLYNGKKHKLIAYVNPQGAQPVVLRSALKGKKGKNQQLKIPIPINCVLGTPPDCGGPEGSGDVRIVHLDLAFKKFIAHKKKHGKKVKVPFVKTPKKCTSGGWVFTFIFRHRDGSGAETKTSISPCVKP
jgi:hypothetical protein